MNTADLLVRLSTDPKRMDVLVRALDDPRKAIESLDILIRDKATTPESRVRYQELRSALEAFFMETGA